MPECASVPVCVRVCGVCLLTSIPFFVGAALQQATTRQQVEETTNWFRQIPSPCGKGAARLSGYARDGNWAETGTGTGTGNWWLLTGDRRLWVAYKAEPVWSSGLPMSWRKSNFNVLLPKSIKSWIIAQDVCTCVEDMRNRVPVPESRSRPPRCLAPCHCTEPPSPAPGYCWWWLRICLLCRALGLPGFVHLTLFLSLFLSPPPSLCLATVKTCCCARPLPRSFTLPAFVVLTVPPLQTGARLQPVKCAIFVFVLDST